MVSQVFKAGTDGRVTAEYDSVTGGLGLSAEVDALSRGLYGANSASMRNFRFGWGTADAPNEGACHIAWFGDSIGLKSGGNNTFTIAQRIQTLLQRQATSYTGQAQPSFPMWFPATPQFFTPVETLTGTWANANIGPFSQFGYISSEANAKISWASRAGTTGARIHYRRTPGGGSFTAKNASNASFGTQTTAGAEGFAYVDYSGGEPVSVTVDGAGPVTIIGIEPLITVTGTSVFAPIRHDGQLGVKVSRFSVSGYKIGQLVTESSLAYACDYLRPHLAIVALMSNDAYFQTAVAQYKSDLAKFAKRAKSNGTDVLFVGCPPFVDDRAIKIKEYATAMREAALENTCAYLDLPAMWGSWELANAAELMSDNQHPSMSGVNLEAAQIAQAIIQTI